MGESSGAKQDTKYRIARFECGLEAFQSADFDKARSVFQEVLALFPDDNPSKLYLDRIAVFKKTPPGKDWDGVTLLDHK